MKAKFLQKQLSRKEANFFKKQPPHKVYSHPNFQATMKHIHHLPLLFLLCLFCFSTALPAAVVPLEFGFRGIPVGVKMGANQQIEKITLKGKMELPPARLARPIGGEFSLEFWMRAESEALLKQSGPADDNAPMTLLALDTTDAPNQNNRQLLIIRLSEGKVVVVCTLDRQRWSGMTSSVRIEANQWYHVALTRTGKETDLYVNGAFAASSDSLPALANMTDIIFGRHGPRRYFVGTLLNPRAHDRALNSAEIKALAGNPPGEMGGALPGATEDAGPASFDRYPTLRVAPGELHPLIEQLEACVTVVHWRGPRMKDLIVRGIYPKYMGSRAALYQQQGVDHRGLPYYDEGTTIKGLPGIRVCSVAHGDGKEELFAKFEASINSKSLIAYTKDTAGGGGFSAVRKVKIEPALDGQIGGWSVGDVDGDGIPDLLVALIKNDGTSYWPDKADPWRGVERKDIGKGRGYDLQDQWLGDPTTHIIYWAKGRINPSGELEFVDRKPVHYRHAGFDAQWRGWGQFALACVKIAGRPVILVAGNNDRIQALSFVLKNQELIVEDSSPLLEGGASVRETFWTYSISVLEEKSDGTLRLVLDGNASRLVVLEGKEIGRFREAGTLLMQGGPVAVDTLGVPARIDWDGDGFEDLIIGDSSGWLTFWRGTKDPMVYHAGVQMTSGGKVIHHQAGPTGSIQGANEARFGYTQPAVEDWDGNGKPVIITADVTTKLTLYRATDKPTDLAAPVVFTKDGKPYEVAWRSRPAIIPAKMNFAGSGLPALLHTDWDGHLAVAIPDKLGSTNIARVVKLTGTDGKPIGLCGVSGFWGRIETCVADWNGDGKWDILFGTVPGNHKCFSNDNLPEASPWWLENVGTNEKPVFAKVRPIKLRDGSPIQLGMHNASVSATDLNGDGKLDLIVGSEDGRIYRFPRSELE